jgi:hypothetical protein
VEASEDNSEVSAEGDMASDTDIPEVTDISDEILDGIESEEDKTSDAELEENSSTEKEKGNSPTDPDK